MTTKQRVEQIRKALEFSKTLGGDPMPSEAAIEDLLAEIDRLTTLGAEANVRLREVEKEAQDKWFAQETEIERLRVELDKRSDDEQEIARRVIDERRANCECPVCGDPEFHKEGCELGEADAEIDRLSSELHMTRGVIAPAP